MTATVLILGLSCASASAVQLTPIDNAATLKECGACHIAYPPQMLPGRSWQAILDNLARHFGEDASLPKTVQSEIAHYLMSMSADSSPNAEGSVFLRGIASDQTPLRITDTPIWRLIHGDPDQTVFKRPDITSAANCAACHTAASRGEFFGE
jgi:hypothetical protein